AQKAFNTFYNWYPYLYEGEQYGHCYQTLAQYVKRTTNRHPTLLDVGCAHGLGAEILNDNGIRYWGVDVSEALIQKAKERERHETFVVADMIKVLLNYGGYNRWLGRGKQPLTIPGELDVIA